MNKNSKYLVPSAIDAGKAYNVYFYKPDGRPAYVKAVQVEPWTDESGARGFTYVIDFKRKPGECQAMIEGPATAKKIAAAFCQVFDALKAGGFIAADYQPAAA